MPPRPDAALRARAAAAHEVLRDEPGVDRLELLAAVCWPLRPELAELQVVGARRDPGRQLGSSERERIFTLAASGLSGYAIARELGRPRSTIADVLRHSRHAELENRAA